MLRKALGKEHPHVGRGSRPETARRAFFCAFLKGVLASVTVFIGVLGFRCFVVNCSAKKEKKNVAVN